MTSSLRMQAVRATFFGLAGRQESLVEVSDGWVEAAGNHCSHVQNCLEPRPTTPKSASYLEAFRYRG